VREFFPKTKNRATDLRRHKNRFNRINPSKTGLNRKTRRPEQGRGKAPREHVEIGQEKQTDQGKNRERQKSLVHGTEGMG
jgi:hypothetical protein